MSMDPGPGICGPRLCGEKRADCTMGRSVRPSRGEMLPLMATGGRELDDAGEVRLKRWQGRIPQRSRTPSAATPSSAVN